jgi:hypothetical protein
LSCAAQPAITTGSDTTIDTAARCAKNSPSAVTKLTKYTGAVAAWKPVTFIASKNSFQVKIKHINAVAEIPGRVMGAKTLYRT